MTQDAIRGAVDDGADLREVAERLTDLASSSSAARDERRMVQLAMEAGTLAVGLRALDALVRDFGRRRPVSAGGPTLDDVMTAIARYERRAEVWDGETVMTMRTVEPDAPGRT